MLAKAGCSQFFAFAKEEIREEIQACRWEGQTLMQFAKDQDIKEVQEALSDIFDQDLQD